MSEIMFVVEQYTDQIKAKPRREAEARTWNEREKWPYRFSFEDQAREFIIQRARNEVMKAQRELRLANTRLRKCEKKFGTANESTEAQPTPEAK